MRDQRAFFVARQGSSDSSQLINDIGGRCVYSQLGVVGRGLHSPNVFAAFQRQRAKYAKRLTDERSFKSIQKRRDAPLDICRIELQERNGDTTESS